MRMKSINRNNIPFNWEIKYFDCKTHCYIYNTDRVMKYDHKHLIVMEIDCSNK